MADDTSPNTRLGPMRVIYLADELGDNFDAPREGHAYVVLEASLETVCRVPLYGFVHLHSSFADDEARCERDYPEGCPICDQGNDGGAP